jgi:ATP-dependent Clp protease ATP-binding subunit ClpC
MSEYMEKHATSRLIGAPPGYIGYEAGGTLTEAIRRQPYKVILCDEIEKAHPDVLDLFLQIMEEGTLTDHLGHAVSFKNTFIIMSSNVGAKEIKTTPMGFSSQQKNDNQDHQITNEMKKWFKPEFINRFDKIIVFNSLSKNDQRKILELELQKTKNKLQPITLNISEDGKDFLLEKGFNSEQGARPLQRIITSLIEDPISELIIRKNLKKGLIQITKANDQLEFKQ